MKLSDIPADTGRKKRKRVGRGESSGWGKTAGRGHKGQKSRSGGAKPPYFEGGQMPLIRRLPKKKGFFPLHRRVFQVVNLGQIAQKFPQGGLITPEMLEENGLVRSQKEWIKVLGEGEIGAQYELVADAISRSAEEKIVQGGGAFQRRDLWKKEK